MYELLSLGGPLLIPWFRYESVVIDLGGMDLVLHTFQVTMLMAVGTALLIAIMFAHRHQRSAEQTAQFAVFIMAFAFPLSVLFNGLFYAPHAVVRLLEQPTDLSRFQLGWSMYGGVVGGLIGAWVWKWRSGGSILEIGDAFGFAGPFGWFFGRVGCFLVHDHPGRVSNFALAVADYEVGAPPYLPRHDLGLYDAIVLAALAALFLFLSRSSRKPGFYLALLALLHPPTRFLLDFLRAPAAEGGDVRFMGLTPAQYAAVGLFVVGVMAMRTVRRSPLPPS